jgi:hypothetical protein
MLVIEATGLHRKSGGAQWRDLCVDAPSWECFSCRAKRSAGHLCCGPQRLYPLSSRAQPRDLQSLPFRNPSLTEYPSHIQGLIPFQGPTLAMHARLCENREERMHVLMPPKMKIRLIRHRSQGPGSLSAIKHNTGALFAP